MSRRLTRFVPRCTALALALAALAPATAQVIPWFEPAPADTAEPLSRNAASEPSEPVERATRDRRRPQITRADNTDIGIEKSDTTGSWFDLGTYFTQSIPATLTLSHFGGTTADGAARSGTTWIGQTTQGSGTLTVGGNARDDNGWGATGLSLDASGMTYLNITAQRDTGHAAPTLFIQFEDRNSQTKVLSVGAAQFAFGAQTLVQIPLNGWTIDFGPSQITGWNLGGGSVGTTDFRMTFDSISFTTTAIPEPSTYAALLGALGFAVAWCRRVAALARRPADRVRRPSSSLSRRQWLVVRAGVGVRETLRPGRQRAAR